MELVEGIEPPAQDLQKPCSATELHQQIWVGKLQLAHPVAWRRSLDLGVLRPLGATCRLRSDDLSLTMRTLYQLS